MLVRNCPVGKNGLIEFTIGDVVVKIWRLGEKTATVGVSAPREMPITFKDDATTAEIQLAVEQALSAVLQGPDDKA